MKPPTPTSYIMWQLPALKSLCKDRGIPRTADKQILAKRLKEWDSQNNTLKLTPRTPKRPRQDDDNDDDKGGSSASNETPKKQLRMTIFPKMKQRTMKDVVNVESPVVNKIVEKIVNDIVTEVGDRRQRRTDDSELVESRDVVLLQDDVKVIVKQNLQTKPQVVECYDINKSIETSQETTGRINQKQQDAKTPDPKENLSKLRHDDPTQSPGIGVLPQPSSTSSNFHVGIKTTDDGSQVSPKHENHAPETNNK